METMIITGILKSYELKNRKLMLIISCCLPNVLPCVMALFGQRCFEISSNDIGHFVKQNCIVD